MRVEGPTSTDCEQRYPCGGFSLAEALMAVAIIALLAAIAVPGLMASLRAAREGRAIATLRTLSAAQMSLHGSLNRFGIFEELFARGVLAPNSFRRGGPTGSGSSSSGASEVISDGAYDYSMRFASDSRGITLDADPSPRLAASHRRFRVRLGRVTGSGASGAEGCILVAAPSASQPPASAYRPLGS